jgi:hypothetical protein
LRAARLYEAKGKENSRDVVPAKLNKLYDVSALVNVRSYSIRLYTVHCGACIAERQLAAFLGRSIKQITACGTRTELEIMQTSNRHGFDYRD